MTIRRILLNTTLHVLWLQCTNSFAPFWPHSMSPKLVTDNGVICRFDCDGILSVCVKITGPNYATTTRKRVAGQNKGENESERGTKEVQLKDELYEIIASRIQLIERNNVINVIRI